MDVSEVAQIDRSIQQQVQEQLTGKGEYSPVELLIARGRLIYVDYEEWRRGRVATLDDVLIGDRRQILELVQQASQYAEQTGLSRESIEWVPWVDRQSSYRFA